MTTGGIGLSARGAGGGSVGVGGGKESRGGSPREICVGLRWGEAKSSAEHREGLRVWWDPCGGPWGTLDLSGAQEREGWDAVRRLEYCGQHGRYSKGLREQQDPCGAQRGDGDTVGPLQERAKDWKYGEMHVWQKKGPAVAVGPVWGTPTG